MVVVRPAETSPPSMDYVAQHSLMFSEESGKFGEDVHPEEPLPVLLDDYELDGWEGKVEGADQPKSSDELRGRVILWI